MVNFKKEDENRDFADFFMLKIVPVIATVMLGMMIGVWGVILYDSFIR